MTFMLNQREKTGARWLNSGDAQSERLMRDRKQQESSGKDEIKVTREIARDEKRKFLEEHLPLRRDCAYDAKKFYLPALLLTDHRPSPSASEGMRHNQG